MHSGSVLAHRTRSANICGYRPHQTNRSAQLSRSGDRLTMKKNITGSQLQARKRHHMHILHPRREETLDQNVSNRIDRILLNSSLLENPSAIPCHFNRYFHSVFSISRIPASNSSFLPDIDVVSYNGILNMLLKLKVKSSPGHDSLHSLFCVVMMKRQPSLPLLCFRLRLDLLP